MLSGRACRAVISPGLVSTLLPATSLSLRQKRRFWLATAGRRLLHPGAGGLAAQAHGGPPGTGRHQATPCHHLLAKHGLHFFFFFFF